MTPERFAKLQSALDRRQPDLTVYMDAVNKSHNVSAIIRTADAVGIHRLHALSTGGALRRHHMISGGATHFVELTLHASTAAALAALRGDGWQLVAAHAGPSARDYRDVDYTAKVAIMVGAELIGLSDAALAAAADPNRDSDARARHVAERLGRRRRHPARSGAAAPRGWILRGLPARARRARAYVVRVVLPRDRGALPCSSAASTRSSRPTE